MNIRIQCLCIDSTDPAKVASFWEEALGWRRTFDEDDQVVLEPPAGSPEDGIAPDLLFLRVSDDKHVKNRVHLDLRPADGTREQEVERVLALGASYLADHRRPDGRGWMTLADPVGNEFCILSRDPASSGATT